VPDPKKHADSRGLIETVARWIPGFHGYLEKEYRRDADSLARKWLADRLDKSKPALDDLVRNLTSHGQLDELDDIENFRSKLDHLVGRFRSAPQGYSGFFDYVRIKEEQLNDVYVTDASLFGVVDELAGEIESMKTRNESIGEMLHSVAQKLQDASTQFDKRADILAGVSD
jgi:hypothetical protein